MHANKAVWHVNGHGERDSMLAAMIESCDGVTVIGGCGAQGEMLMHSFSGSQ